MQISSKTIDFLKDLVTGDSKITEYKSGPRLVEFFNSLGFNDSYGQGFPSRWAYAKQKIEEVNSSKKLEDLIKSLLNPINFIDNEENLFAIIESLNKYLDFDGYKVLIKDKKCKIVTLNSKEVEIENTKHLDDDFILEQIKKSEEKITLGDFDGAITNARSLLESVIGHIHKHLTGEELEKTGDLKKDYKNVRNSLNLTPDKYADENIKQILNGFISIVDGIDRISNQMGDRHRRRVKPEKHHAKLAVNSAKTLSDFLYDTWLYQKNKK